VVGGWQADPAPPVLHIRSPETYLWFPNLQVLHKSPGDAPTAL
jgi:hypothetical protein